MDASRSKCQKELQQPKAHLADLKGPETSQVFSLGKLQEKLNTRVSMI